jgi:hypothetical protein
VIGVAGSAPPALFEAAGGWGFDWDFEWLPFWFGVVFGRQLAMQLRLRCRIWCFAIRRGLKRRTGDLIASH